MVHEFYKEVVDEFETRMAKSLQDFENDLKEDPSDQITRDIKNTMAVCYNMFNDIKKEAMDRHKILYKQVNPLDA